MPTFEVKPRDLGKSLREDGERMRAAVVEAIQTSVALHAPRIFQATVNTTVPPPVDRGTYRRSFRVEKTPSGSIFYNFAPQSPVIEGGRRPGARMPPVDVILAWVRRKRIGATFVGPVRKNVRVRSGLGGKARTLNTRKASVDQQQRAIAWNIVRAIGRRGQPARHVLAMTEAVLTPIVERAIDEALGKV